MCEILLQKFVSELPYVYALLSNTCTQKNMSHILCIAMQVPLILLHHNKSKTRYVIHVCLLCNLTKKALLYL